MEDQRLVVTDAEDARRWEETRLRRRIMDGLWAEDIRLYLIDVLGQVRAQSIGRMSRAVNLLTSYCDQVGIAHDQTPTVHAPEDADPDAVAAFEAALEDARVWEMSRRHTRYVIGLRECWRLLEWVDGEDDGPGHFRLEVVTPDETTATTRPGDVDKIQQVRRARVREVKGKPVQIWDVWDLPSRRFWLEAPNGKDVTTEILGGAPEWTTVDDEGAYLPWVLTHAESTGHLWDAYALCELVDATFDGGVLWNNYHKAMRDASWRQKYAVNLRLRGVTPDSAGGAHIVTAPDSILSFEGDSDRPGSLGTFEAPVDVESFAGAVLQFQRTALAAAGIHPADIERTEGQASSGYAIQLRRSAQRQAARQHEGELRRADEQLLRLAAREWNRAGNPPVPTEGWGVTYRYPDDSPAEQAERLALQRGLIEAGLLSPIDAWKEWHPGSDDNDAARGLMDAALIRRALQPAALDRLLAQGDDIDAEDLRDAGRGTMTMTREDTTDGRAGDGAAGDGADPAGDAGDA